MTAGDFDVRDFAHLLDELAPTPPITTAWHREHRAPSTWWRTEREHMVSWFGSQVTRGSGGYTRATPNHSAKKTYNRLLNAGSVLWIAEALGAPTETVAQAAAMAAAEPDYRRRPALVRRLLPWETIYDLAAPRISRRWSGTQRMD